MKYLFSVCCCCDPLNNCGAHIHSNGPEIMFAVCTYGVNQVSCDSHCVFKIHKKSFRIYLFFVCATVSSIRVNKRKSVARNKGKKNSSTKIENRSNVPFVLSDRNSKATPEMWLDLRNELCVYLSLPAPEIN